MGPVLRLMIIGATLVGLLAFFLNNDYGQHIVADFFSLFRAQEIQAKATEFTQASRQAKDLADESRRQQEEFQQLLNERASLYADKLEQMRTIKDKIRSIQDSADTANIGKLKEMIRKYSELDQRWRNMGTKVNQKAELLKELNERNRQRMAREKEKQRELIDKSKSKLGRNQDKLDDLRDKMDRKKSQQEEMKDKMEALRERMHR